MTQDPILEAIKRPMPERFRQTTSDGVEYSPAFPPTEEELQEAAETWDMIKGKGTSKPKS